MSASLDICIVLLFCTCPLQCTPTHTLWSHLLFGMPLSLEAINLWQEKVASMMEPTRTKFLGELAAGTDEWAEWEFLPEAAMRGALKEMAGLGSFLSQVQESQAIQPRTKIQIQAKFSSVQFSSEGGKRFCALPPQGQPKL